MPRVGADFLRNIIYDIQNTRTTAADCDAVHTISGARTTNIIGNTVHNIINDNGSGPTTNFELNSSNNVNVALQNNIATDPVGTSSGAKNCYEIPGNVVEDHNLSSDGTAAGTGSLTTRTAANQFVSITGGSEDLHLKSGADAIDTAVDLGTSPTEINIDIDLRDVDAQGDTWDMGADEFVAAVTALQNRLLLLGVGV
jgi:hypothetical protein